MASAGAYGYDVAIAVLAVQRVALSRAGGRERRAEPLTSSVPNAHCCRQAQPLHPFEAMRRILVPAIVLVLGALGCDKVAQRDLRTEPVEALAGCYEFALGPALHWLPTPLSGVDTATAARLRVILETTPDSSGPVRRAFAVEPKRRDFIMSFTWSPTVDGIRIVQYGADTGFELVLSGGPSEMEGHGRSSGSIEGGTYRYAVVGHRLSCDGFVPGYDPPREGVSRS
jgi:hypothetical protein